MSKVTLVKQAAAPDTPGTGRAVVYVDANGRLALRREDGNVRSMADRESDNAFAVAQTMTQIKPTAATIANNAALAIAGTYGLLIVQNGTDGGQALIWLSAGTTTIIHQAGAYFGTTQGTAGKINVYMSANVAYIENKLGASKQVYYQTMAV